MKTFESGTKPYIEKNEWKAALDSRCPRCRTGYMFTGRIYGLKSQKMNETCPHCLLKFEQRPGHFYVAMFVSYAMSVAEMIGACLIIYLMTGNGDSFWLYAISAILTVFLLAPVNYRYSRIILLYWLTPGINFREDRYAAKREDR